MIVNKPTLFFLFLITSSLASPVSIFADTEDDPNRLPSKTIVSPISYIIQLNLPIDTFTTNEFNGKVQIKIDVKVDDLESIKLHSKELKLSNQKLELITDPSTSEENLLVDGDLVSDNITDILTITPMEPLKSGIYLLSLDFSGTYSEYDMHGLYISSYKNADGSEEYLVTTQFEATHARRVFPCFDEPEFKATFEVSITAPEAYTSLANGLADSEPKTEAGLKTTSFQSTPRMSTYLNAFIISKFTCKKGTKMQNEVPQSICSRPEAILLQEYALGVSPKIMDYLSDFTNLTYNHQKMDQVAIPDFSAGAMENWGLVTYRETNILYSPDDSTNLNKQRQAAVIAHEFAHMWFGNLVTTKWWSDLFLQEGFARYFQYFATAQIETEMELPEQFVIEQVQACLLYDSSATVSALSSPVSTQAEIGKKFDTISYNKGASIYRMLEHVIGSENFKLGLQKYVGNEAVHDGSTVPKDLWNSFEVLVILNSRESKNVNELMNQWTVKQGYPVITVSTSADNKTTLTQEQVLLNGETTSTKWYVPISVSRKTVDFTKTTPNVWLKPNDDSVELDELKEGEFLTLNNQQTGYFRVLYTEPFLKQILTILESESRTDIERLTRSQIVDDLFYFARAKKTTFSKVLSNLRWLTSEDEYYVWYPAISGFSYLLQRVGDSEINGALTTHILELLEHFYNSTGFEEKATDHGFTLKQVLAVNWACRLGSEDCVTKAKYAFSTFKSESTKPYVNLRTTIYCTALRNGDAEDFEFLWNQLKDVQVATDEIIILSALGCTRDETSLKKFLNEAVTDNGLVRRQDLSTAVASVYNGNPTLGVSVVFDFIANNFDKVLSYYKTKEALVSLLETLTGRINTQAEVTKLEEFKINISTDYASELDKMIASAKSNLETTKSIEEEVTNFISPKPIDPVHPVEPVDPEEPKPEDPEDPKDPEEPKPEDPEDPTDPNNPEDSGASLSGSFTFLVLLTLSINLLLFIY